MTFAIASLVASKSKCSGWNFCAGGRQKKGVGIRTNERSRALICSQRRVRINTQKFPNRDPQAPGHLLAHKQWRRGLQAPNEIKLQQADPQEFRLVGVGRANCRGHFANHQGHVLQRMIRRYQAPAHLLCAAERAQRDLKPNRHFEKGVKLRIGRTVAQHPKRSARNPKPFRIFWLFQSAFLLQYSQSPRQSNENWPISTNFPRET